MIIEKLEEVRLISTCDRLAALLILYSKGVTVHKRDGPVRASVLKSRREEKTKHEIAFFFLFKALHF